MGKKISTAKYYWFERILVVYRFLISFLLDLDVPMTGEDDDADPDTFTMPADESRDRCAICGINFKMFFDNEDGIYKYSNCREIEVLNDEAAVTDSEDMLVHVTCWRNLGSPELLNAEQIISRF